MHPLLGRGAIALVLRPEEGGGKDTVVGVGEGPDSRIGSRRGGNGAKFVAWVENLSHSMFEKKGLAYV